MNENFLLKISLKFNKISIVTLLHQETNYNTQLPREERRFRQAFVAIFGGMVAITLIWATDADTSSIVGRWADLIVALCALLGIAGSRMAVSFRRRHPLVTGAKRKTPLPAAANDKVLAQRILKSIESENRFATPDLKVADLARALSEQEYKVSQCITGQLGYRNFNHLINAHRIKHAKALLKKPETKNRPILSVAFDCGFNSIGPFNRAFKQEVGITPREFRAEKQHSP